VISVFLDKSMSKQVPNADRAFLGNMKGSLFALFGVISETDGCNTSRLLRNDFLGPD
jgi:hypothetical protein